MPQIGPSPHVTVGSFVTSATSPASSTRQVTNTLVTSYNSSAEMADSTAQNENQCEFLAAEKLLAKMSAKWQASARVLNSLNLLERSNTKEVYIAYNVVRLEHPDLPFELVPSTHGAVKDMIPGGVTIASTTAEQARLRVKEEYLTDDIALARVDVLELQTVSLDENWYENAVRLALHVGQGLKSNTDLDRAMMMAQTYGEIHVAGVIPPERFHWVKVPDLDSNPEIGTIPTP